MHSTIERNIGATVETPRDYCLLMETARRCPQPYHVHRQYFNHFKKIQPEYLTMTSMRPGKKVGDPVVNDISHIKYDPGCDMQNKLKANKDAPWESTPQRPADKED